MVINNPDYTIESFSFEKDDYLKQIFGCIDDNKNFKYLKFVTANQRTYEVGNFEEEAYQDGNKMITDHVKKIKMKDYERPVCINIALQPISGKIPFFINWQLKDR